MKWTCPNGQRPLLVGRSGRLRHVKCSPRRPREHGSHKPQLLRQEGELDHVISSFLNVTSIMARVGELRVALWLTGFMNFNDRGPDCQQIQQSSDCAYLPPSLSTLFNSTSLPKASKSPSASSPLYRSCKSCDD